MFLRRFDALPKDPVFPTDLKELGYFVNEDDEIRSIEDPQYYFKYRLDKNDRINERQRFHFNLAIQDVVHERLEKEGLKKIRLPFGTPATKHHVPIFVSNDISRKSRVVLIFGEPCQQLGHLALRIMNGKGGINKGSMVSVVQALKQQKCSAQDAESPGIILANTGELFWWETEKRPIPLSLRGGMPLPSMVHYGATISNWDFLESQRDIQEHMWLIFNKVLPALVSKTAKIDLIGIGSGGDELTMALDLGLFRLCQDQISTLSLMGTINDREEFKDKAFKAFMTRRARTWVNSTEPLGTPIANHNGNPYSKLVFCHQGTAGVYSAGVGWHNELIFIHALPDILEWIQTVATAGARYRHPAVVVTYRDPVYVEPEWSQDSGDDDHAAGAVKVAAEKAPKGAPNNCEARNGDGGHAAEAGRNGPDIKVAVEKAPKDAPNNCEARNGDVSHAAKAGRNGTDIEVTAEKAPKGDSNNFEARNGDGGHAAEADCNGPDIKVTADEAPKAVPKNCEAQNGDGDPAAEADCNGADIPVPSGEAPKDASKSFEAQDGDGDHAAAADCNGADVTVAGGEAPKGASNDCKAQNGIDAHTAEADCEAQNGDGDHTAEANCNGADIAAAGGKAPKGASNDREAQNGGDRAVAVGGDGANEEVTGSEAPQRASSDLAVSENKYGLNFFAEEGGESPRPRMQQAQDPSKQAHSGRNEPINFFADLSDDEEDDMDEETKARLNKGIERFLATGSMMDPREEERIEAEIQDIKDGIAGMY